MEKLNRPLHKHKNEEIYTTVGRMQHPYKNHFSGSTTRTACIHVYLGMCACVIYGVYGAILLVQNTNSTKIHTVKKC